MSPKLTCEKSRWSRVAFGLCLVTLLGFTGCLQLAANLLHVVNGPQVPAEFKALDSKRVAVVSVDESGLGRNESTIRLAGILRGILANKLAKATLVTQEEVDRWLGDRVTASHDYVAIGQGVKADYVIAVQMQNLQLRDGPTLFRGKADVAVTVWDVQSGKAVFNKSLPEYTYPTIAGLSTTETDEAKFQRIYLMNVADKLARYFYAHDLGEDVAIDATILQY